MSEHTTTEGLTEDERQHLHNTLSNVGWVSWLPTALERTAERILADRLAAVGCGICADHARVDALIQRSSLGSSEATAVRESVPNDIGIAIATAARHMARARSAEAERDAARAEVEALRKRVGALADEWQAHEGRTWIASLGDDLRAALKESA